MYFWMLSFLAGFFFALSVMLDDPVLLALGVLSIMASTAFYVVDRRDQQIFELEQALKTWKIQDNQEQCKILDLRSKTDQL